MPNRNDVIGGVNEVKFVREFGELVFVGRIKKTKVLFERVKGLKGKSVGFGHHEQLAQSLNDVVLVVIVDDSFLRVQEPTGQFPYGYSFVDPSNEFGECQPNFTIFCGADFQAQPQELYETYVKFDTFTPAVEHGFPVTRVISQIVLQKILSCAIGEDIIMNSSNVVNFVDDGNKLQDNMVVLQERIPVDEVFRELNCCSRWSH
ncbi:hypothetical protein VNO77_01993 [Canavalia gladiata]|uniref:Uncharacterized protein n=1 Tax=Canavalia gladiata TaxID=3824 RepID=A0AAN9R5P9_CANGL